MFKLIKWLIFIVILLALFVLIGLPLLLNTAEGRKQLAKVLSKATDREVKFEDLSVGLFLKSASTKNLTISNPEGFPEGLLLDAGSLDFDIGLRTLLDGKLTGDVEASGVKLSILQLGNKSNLDGLGSGGGDDAPEEKDGSGGIDMDLKLSLSDSTVSIRNLDTGDNIVVTGVDLKVRLTNADNVTDTKLTLRIDSMQKNDLVVKDINVDAVLRGDKAILEKLSAIIGEKGKLNGNATVNLKGDKNWKADLTLSEVGLDKGTRPMVARLFPVASAADQFDGMFDAEFHILGQGLSWNAMKPTLTGNGKVNLKGLALPSKSLLVQLASAAGHKGGAVELNEAGAQFELRDQWIQFHRLSARGDKVRYDLTGRVSFAGKLDLKADMQPLIDRYGGGDLKKFSKKAGGLKLRIGGTTDTPKIKPPDVKDVLEGGAGGLLDKLKKKIGGG